MKVDYIVVGCGLAGINFCEKLFETEKSFIVFDDKTQHSSVVAGGLYNPVVLKRFTLVWKSKEQLVLASSVYEALEDKLGIELDFKLPVRRLFHSTEEQNNWFVASDKIELSEYLSTNLLKNDNPSINAPFGFGEVLSTGRIDTSKLITEYKRYLMNSGLLNEESFDYESLKVEQDAIQYKNVSSEHIVFAEGFGLKKNPFFNHLPLNGTKGELLTIYAPELNIDYVLKSSAFLIPYGNNHYKVGATYEWTDKSNYPTEQGKEELLTKLKTIINCPFEVVDHTAGIRPTVIDRKPLVGTHSLYNRLHILNGLGTRGVMIGPYVAKALFEAIEKSKPLDQEINISRFL